VEVAGIGAAAQPALGLRVLAAGVEQYPDAGDRLRARLVVLSGAAEPALRLIVPVRVVEHAGQLLRRLVPACVGGRAEDRHRLVVPVLVAQQRREVDRRDFVAEVDAAAVDRLGLGVAAQPAQHPGQVVGGVDLAALERPAVPPLGRTEVRRLGARGCVAEVERGGRVGRLGRGRRPARPRLAAAVAVGEVVQVRGRLAVASFRRALEPRTRARVVAAPLAREPDVKGGVRVAAIGRRPEVTLGGLVVAPLLGAAPSPERPHEGRVPAARGLEAARRLPEGR
jgi:hypothetical protein